MEKRKKDAWIPGTIIFIAGVVITLAAFTGGHIVQVITFVIVGLPFMAMGVWIILRSFTPRPKG